MKIILNGAGGYMGRIMAGLIESAEGMELSAMADICFVTDPDKGTYKSITEYGGEADMVIDFSIHTGTASLMDYCSARSLPVVIATTGHTPEELSLIEEASKSIAVFKSANMSLGIAVLSDLIKRAARSFPDADIEIVETHHNRKIDVPSGTALMLADEIKYVRSDAVYNIGRPSGGRRKKEEIGIHSLRYGSEVGTHEIIISTGNETISIKHEALDRSLFADGALKAAAFLRGRPAGLYDMKDLVG